MNIRDIGDLIAGRAFACIAPDKTVAEACQLMSAADVAVLVVVKDCVPFGIVTERDVVRRCDALGVRADVQPVEAIMAPAPVTLSRRASLAEALRRMYLGGCEHLPVVDRRGHAIGVVSIADIPMTYRLMVERFSDYSRTRRGARLLAKDRWHVGPAAA